MSEQKRFTLNGHLWCTGKVEVEAETLEEAAKKARGGDFVATDIKDYSWIAFTWDQDPTTVKTEPL